MQLVSPTGEISTHELKQTSPGIWRKTIKAQTGGLFRLSSGELNAAIHVGRINSRELESVTASLDPLAPLMKTTGGTAIWQGSAQSHKKAFPRLLMNNKGRQMHGPGWLALADRKAYQVRTSSTIPLFSGITGAGFVAGCSCPSPGCAKGGRGLFALISKPIEIRSLLTPNIQHKDLS